MSVLGITSEAIAIARTAARSASASRDTALEGQLTDLVIHLAELKVLCAVMLDENLTLRNGAVGQYDECDEAFVVGPN